MLKTFVFLLSLLFFCSPIKLTKKLGSLQGVRVINCADGDLPQVRKGLVVNCADDVPGSSIIVRGYIKDATTNSNIPDDRLTGATVSFTSNQGQIFPAKIVAGSIYEATVTSGTYKIKATANGYADTSNTKNITTSANESSGTMNIFLSPIVQGWRIILTWNNVMKDLDAHMVVPGGVEVYYPQANRASPDGKVTLDTDARNGNGPETITMTSPDPGVYKYYVAKFSTETTLQMSGAKVTVYRGSQQLKEFNVPNTGLPDDKFWYVGDVDVAADTFNEVNKIQTSI